MAFDIEDGPNSDSLGGSFAVVTCFAWVRSLACVETLNSTAARVQPETTVCHSMSSWKRDFSRGLIVLAPIIVIGYLCYVLYGFVDGFTPNVLVPGWLLETLIENETVRARVTAVLRVLVSGSLLLALLYACGLLARTALGAVVERAIDTSANALPGVRVVYNASKTAAETAVNEQTELRQPVKLEVWDDIRMTAFKTGRSTNDGQGLYFVPTSPNVTSGFLVEADPNEVEQLDEPFERALGRIISGGFGNGAEVERDDAISIDVIDAVDQSRSDATNTTENKDRE